MRRPEGYYRSKHMLRLGAALLEVHPYCSACENTKNLLIHHRTYVNWPNEKPEDLSILCPSCHTTIHANIERLKRRDAQPHRQSENDKGAAELRRDMERIDALEHVGATQ